MMRLPTAFVFALFCILGLSVDPRPAITGQVTDSQGAAIANARVLVHWDSSGSSTGLTDNIGLKQDVIVSTAMNGSYSASVPPGFYDVFVSKESFTPNAAKVRVKREKLTTFSTELEIDPLVTKELGDEIAAPH
jgi:hypothetical protein